ncbi:hypothetical protein [Streptomyces flavofungini]|uniref:Uncharacterized protein n=1 Tax=Streptomyces flavofungini TaxID=68200 RepID=A0ABS0XF31_9ACTN|nr:hypothetical protein [Streptomyces flavofungini]MBJ3811591.1 hypothetical protein [Streptomyces flavofungini]GHC86056.1 hypothetical protein GCM10010349_72030 [Streptomyces flavofungini]
MGHTQHDTMRRVLRREVAGTIGLLADAEDFAAMRRYRTFTFDDHVTYLQQVESLLKALSAQGRLTSVALFDPEAYDEFCAETGLDPDTSASRTRFTAELATIGPTMPYEGQALADIVPELVDETVRQSTWEYATMLLARIGACADCGVDIGRTAFARASDLLMRAISTSGPVTRHLVCSIPCEGQTLLAALHVESDADGNPQLDETEALEFTTVLAVGIATVSAGGLVMRTSDGTRDRVHGWRLEGERLLALTAAEVFDAYCTDALSGDLIAPESGVDYCAAPDLGDDEPYEGGHHH